MFYNLQMAVWLLFSKSPQNRPLLSPLLKNPIQVSKVTIFFWDRIDLAPGSSNADERREKGVCASHPDVFYANRFIIQQPAARPPQKLRGLNFQTSNWTWPKIWMCANFWVNWSTFNHFPWTWQLTIWGHLIRYFAVFGPLWTWI